KPDVLRQGHDVLRRALPAEELLARDQDAGRSPRRTDLSRLCASDGTTVRRRDSPHETRSAKGVHRSSRRVVTGTREPSAGRPEHRARAADYRQQHAAADPRRSGSARAAEGAIAGAVACDAASGARSAASARKRLDGALMLSEPREPWRAA